MGCWLQCIRGLTAGGVCGCDRVCAVVCMCLCVCRYVEDSSSALRPLSLGLGSHFVVHKGTQVFC